MIARRISLVLALTLAFAGVAQAQDPQQEITALRARLAEVLRNQERLDRENAELRHRVDSMAKTQARLASENASLLDDEREWELATSIDAMTRGLAGTTVESRANPVTLTGEFRYRTVLASVEPSAASPASEYDGYYTDALVRLGIQYDFTRDVTAFVELQSSWAFGDGAGTAGGRAVHISQAPLNLELNFGESQTPVSLHQGWLQVRNLFGQEELSWRIGRQEIILGNQFQFGDADWFTGWSFDGFRWDWTAESWSLTALALKLNSTDADLNQIHSLFLSHDDDELYGLYFTLDSIENHEIDLYWIYVNGHGGATGGSGNSVGALGSFVGSAGVSFGGTSYYHTIGARIGGVFPDVAAGLDYNVEAAFQFGDTNSGAVQDVDGFAVEAEVGLTFETDSAFRIFARFLFSEGADGSNTGYVPLYPNRHSHSAGFMARYGLTDTLPMFNVLSVQGGFHFNPAEEWTLGATFIWSTTDESVSGIDDDDWGYELDLWASYAYSEHLTFTFALFAVFPEDHLEAFAGIDDDTIFGAVVQARLLF